MRAIIKRPYEPVGRIKEIDNTLEQLQQIVGGYIETVTVDLCRGEPVVIVCNEEGRLDDLPHNCTINGYDFVGTIVAVGADGDEFGDLPELITLEAWERDYLKTAI